MSDTDSPGPLRTGISPKLIASAVLGIVMLLFWAANRNHTRISFLIFDARVRVWVALLVASAFGFVLGYIVARKRD